MTTLMLAPFRISPVLFLGSFCYFQGINLLSLLSWRDVMFTSISFISLATGYFFFEPYTNISVGKFLLGQKIAILKRSRLDSHHKHLKAALARATIKALLPANLIDCLFIFKNKQFSQRYTDKRNGFVVIERSTHPDGSRVIFTVIPLLIMSTVIYYLPLITSTMTIYFFYAPSPGSTGLVSPNTSISVEDTFYRIFMNNLSLDASLVLGGIVFLSLSLLVVFSSSFIEGILISTIFRDQPSAILSGVLPHFFFETAGYIAGIATALAISITILEWISSYKMGVSFGTFASKNYIIMKSIIIFMITSTILIFVGALIEAGMFR
jgi:hypothetical protein